MTANDFAAICEELLIDPAIALENAAVVAALSEKHSADDIRELLIDEA